MNKIVSANPILDQAEFRNFAKSLASRIDVRQEKFFDEIVEAVDSSKKRSGDHILASGLTSDIWAISVSAYILSKPIIEFIWDNAKKPTGELVSHSAAAFKAKLVAWIDSKFASPPPIKISEKSFNELREQLAIEASAAGIKPEAVEKISEFLRINLVGKI